MRNPRTALLLKSGRPLDPLTSGGLTSNERAGQNWNNLSCLPLAGVASSVTGRLAPLLKRTTAGLFLLLSACTPDASILPLKSSESCYTPVSPRQKPPLPRKDAGSPVPLLDSPPPGSRVLGRFEINADFGTVLRALQYNAHRVGADAVVIEKIHWWDVKAWIEPRSVYHTTITEPTDSQKADYQERLKAYEQAKKEGKSATRPDPPRATRETESKLLPGRWDTSSGAFVAALFLETTHAVIETYRRESRWIQTKRPGHHTSMPQGNLSISILDQASPEGNASNFRRRQKQDSLGRHN